MTKTIHIIGVGVVGLAAGCHAQINGYQSQIFELHNLPGGSVPLAAMSGGNAVQLICSAHKKRFVTQTG